MNILRRIIPTIIARITGKKRYLPVIEWSSKSWTHNVFRLYELICWREYGIRAEASAGLKSIIVNGKKKNVIIYEYYTFEATMAGFEGRVRTFLSKIKNFDLSFELPFRLYLYKLQTTNRVDTGLFGSPYVFAIAYDNKSATPASTSASASLTISFTTSGSDRLIASSAVANGPSYTTTGITYNSTALTKINERRDSAGPIQGLWYLAAPATGTNNLVITNSGSVTAGACISFTGADQTAPLDASSLTTESTTTSYSCSVTVATADCMLLCTSRTGNGFTLTGGTNTTIAIQPEVTYFGGGAIWYSTATVGTGSQTLNVTSSSQFFGGGTLASFKPVAGTAYTTERTETVTNTDTLVKSVTRSISETVTNTDTFIKNTIRTVTESITNTDTFSYVMIFYKELSETVTNVDTVLRDIVRNISETVTNNDVINKITTRIVSETTTISETITNMQVKLITLYESLTLIEDFRMFLNSRVARWRDKYNESKTQDWVEKQDL